MLGSLECQLAYAASQLERLKKTNVFNATFHIWHSGHFGTINSFRLGRLPSAPVDWSEINAAWGQTTLLLTALARKMNLTFQRFRLVPFGNHSYIEVLDQHRELPLYGSGGFKFPWDTKFDAAMVAFLDCLQQFKEQVEKGDSGFCLPYRMDRGKIEDSATGNSYSIKWVDTSVEFLLSICFLCMVCVDLFKRKPFNSLLLYVKRWYYNFLNKNLFILPFQNSIQFRRTMDQGLKIFTY